MTGLELKIWLVTLAYTTLLPAFILALIRIGLDHKGDFGSVKSWLGVVGTVFLAFLPVYALHIYLIWNDRLHVDLMLGLSLVFTIVSVIHGLFVLLLIKTIGLFMKPKNDWICGEICATVYFISAGSWWVIFTEQLSLKTIIQ